MKIDLKFFLLATTAFIFISCNQNSPESTEKTDCENAIVDKKIVLLSNYNSAFYDKNYTGTVVNYYSGDTTKIKDIVYYRNGKIFKYETFYENGHLKMHKPIKCNSIHGLMILYSDSLNSRMEIEYKYGRMDGVGKSYYPDGKINKLIHFKNDQQYGEQITFSETGDTLQIEIYENGKFKK